MCHKNDWMIKSVLQYRSHHVPGAISAELKNYISHSFKYSPIVPKEEPPIRDYRCSKCGEYIGFQKANDERRFILF